MPRCYRKHRSRYDAVWNTTSPKKTDDYVRIHPDCRRERFADQARPLAALAAQAFREGNLIPYNKVEGLSWTAIQRSSGKFSRRTQKARRLPPRCAAKKAMTLMPRVASWPAENRKRNSEGRALRVPEIWASWNSSSERKSIVHPAFMHFRVGKLCHLWLN